MNNGFLLVFRFRRFFFVFLHRKKVYDRTRSKIQSENYNHSNGDELDSLVVELGEPLEILVDVVLLDVIE